MHSFNPPNAKYIAQDVARSLHEDLQSGDVTAQLLEDDIEHGYILAKEVAVICGRPWVDECFQQLDPRIEID
jgi:nicotinate-nucleotide pyrophosphorylase (carboxylating)